MVTDRCSTAGFLLLLSHLNPDYKLLYTGLLVLDIASHWFQMKQAGEGEHHKKGNTNFVVKVCFSPADFISLDLPFLFACLLQTKRRLFTLVCVCVW